MREFLKAALTVAVWAPLMLVASWYGEPEGVQMAILGAVLGSVLGGAASGLMGRAFGGGGGGGGGDPSLYSFFLKNPRLLKAVRDAQDKTNTANEARYQDILGIFDRGRDDQLKHLTEGHELGLGELRGALGTLQNRAAGVSAGYDRAIADAESVGESARRRIGEQTTRDLAASRASAAARGLGNTTALDAMNTAALTRRDNAEADLTERIAGLRSSLRARQTDQAASALGDVAQGQAGIGAFYGTRGRELAGLLGDWMSNRTGVMERKTEQVNMPMILSTFQNARDAEAAARGSAGPRRLTVRGQPRGPRFGVGY